MNKTEILASIIIRTKNEEDWIGHCLEAIINQSYKNWKLFVIDDSSQDNSKEIINSYKINNISSLSIASGWIGCHGSGLSFS